MRTAPDSLIALLNSSQQFTVFDLFKIVTVTGITLTYTSYDENITDNGDTYLSNQVIMERSRVRNVIGVEVDSLDITAYPHPADLIAGNEFLKACASGVMDGAHLTLRRGFRNDLGEDVGSYVNFSGRIADMSMSRSQVDITVKSDLELLNVKLPRNVYQATCLHTLYDAGCGLDRNAWKTDGTVSSGTKLSMSCSIMKDAGYYDLGYIVFNTGALAGLRRTIKSYNAGNFTFLNALPSAPVYGDTFSVFAGCDKTQQACGYPEGSAFAVTANATTDQLTKTAHGLVAGNKVQISNTGGALPAPLVAGLDYYVINPSANTFQLALSAGGAAIDLTTAGTGTNKVIKRGKFNNILSFRAFPFIPSPETTR